MINRANNVKKIAWIVISQIFLILNTGCNKKDPSWNIIEPWIGNGSYSILVDSIHQWEARPDFVLDDYEYRYCHSQSTNRLLTNLVQHNFKYRQIREGILDYNTLKQHNVLFINVPTRAAGERSIPDRKLPTFTDEEITAITRFVEEGGGLFVVAEHNNAYDHASVLNPVLEHFDIQIPAAYAREKPPSLYKIGRSDILIRIANFKDHPITRKLRETSWLGGGPLETKYGVAFMSKDGHADLGNYITGKPVKHSNRKVDPGEITGPNIPLIAAVEKGKGRVVVIGDHNTLGIQWLGVADNYRFAMNVFAWLAKRENENPHIADALPIGVKLGWDLEHTDWAPGLRDRRGFHPAFINFSREPRLFTMGLLDLDDPADIILLADPEKEFDEKDIAKLSARLAKGQRMILFADPAEPRKGTVQLLKKFLPELVLKTSAKEITPETMIPGMFDQAPRITQRLPIVSDVLVLPKRLTAAALDPRQTSRDRYAVPKKLIDSIEYLNDIDTEQGAPLIFAIAPDGHRVTVARRFAVNGGEIVLFLQPKMWSNLTFGDMRDEPEINAAYGSHDLQLAFAKWLADCLPIVTENKETPEQPKDTDLTR